MESKKQHEKTVDCYRILSISNEIKEIKRKLKRIKQLKLRKHKYLYSKTANINKENVREMEGYREMGEIPWQKKSWKTFSDSLVTLTFESLASVSTVVTVELRGVARI